MRARARRARHLWALPLVVVLLLAPGADAQEPQIHGQIASSSGPCQQITAATVQCLTFPDELVQVNVRSETSGALLITLRATGLPEGATFPEVQEVGEAESIFLWTPSPTQVGLHEVHFIAETENGSTQINLNLDVVSPTPTPTPSDSPTPTTSPTESPTATPTSSSTPTATSTPPLPTPTGTDSPTATETAAPSPSPTSIDATPTTSGTATPTHTATATPSPSPTKPPSLVGDCDGNGVVSVDELVVGASIALGKISTAVCPPFDPNRDDSVTIDELLWAIGNAINA